ncbi:UNVERIFIED_CONTAM: hypothetical protein Scaly_2960600 [Sesamum calycinum]|uniref:Reticulon-like protein n=1 Tax=Sesamum calycinum TaxID=2727403 RepID=A0AAW2KMF4_9LAMI
MCKSYEYMFLAMVIPGPSNPKCLIYVYLELLLEELQKLWHVGVLTRDSAKNKKITMCAVLMWIVNDLSAYGMTFGGVLLVLCGVQFVWKTHVHSICRTVGRRATLTATNSSSPRIIPIRRNKKAFTKNRVEKKVARPRLAGE